MAIENPVNIKRCPFWRKAITNHGGVLAFCGVTSLREKISDDNDLWPRSRRCPFYPPGRQAAYKHPSIVEVDPTGKISLVKVAKEQGAAGISELELAWDDAVDDFYNKL